MGTLYYEGDGVSPTAGVLNQGGAKCGSKPEIQSCAGAGSHQGQQIDLDYYLAILSRTNDPRPLTLRTVSNYKSEPGLPALSLCARCHLSVWAFALSIGAPGPAQ